MWKGQKKNKANFFSNIGYLKSNIFRERDIINEKLQVQQVLQYKEVRLTVTFWLF